MSKFTQGKWEWRKNILISHDKIILGAILMPPLPADARLIASAPSMYRFLLEVIGNEDICASLEDIDASLEKEIEVLLAYIDGDDEDND